jgi:hypothetical protein
MRLPKLAAIPGNWVYSIGIRQNTQPIGCYTGICSEFAYTTKPANHKCLMILSPSAHPRFASAVFYISHHIEMIKGGVS